MAFLGMRGNGDWVTDQRPKSWRETILYLYPNGKAPLTAIMSKMSKESVNDPEFYWWTKNLASQGGAVSGVYTDAALSTAYVSGATAGDVLYLKVAESVASEFRVGHQALMMVTTDPTTNVNGKVVGVVRNGASSYIAVKLLEDDDNSAHGKDLSDCDQVLVVGNVNAEGAAMPDALAYDPVKYSNLTQIMRTPLSITRTAKKTRLRTGDQYKEAKREALELHGIELEKNAIFSIRSENIGSNGKPERTSDGTISFISKYTSNIFDAVYAGNGSKTWASGGEDFLNENFEVLFRYGPTTDRLGLCGSGALLAINKIAKAGGQFQLRSAQKDYGIQVVEWITPFGTVYLKTHPLFSQNPALRNAMLIVSPQLLKYRYIDDTFFKADDSMKKGGPIGVDGINEEFLTEAGYEIHEPAAFGIFYNLGSDSTT